MNVISKICNLHCRGYLEKIQNIPRQCNGIYGIYIFKYVIYIVVEYVLSLNIWKKFKIFHDNEMEYKQKKKTIFF